MQKLVTRDQIRSLEVEWANKHSSNGLLDLMEKAGSALAEEIAEFNEPYLIVCGKGNNGGDGFVAARYLYESGKKVNICLTSDESLLSKDARANFIKIKDKINCVRIENEYDKNFLLLLKESNTVIDCILGTGAKKDLPLLFEWIIKSINDSGKNVVACDIPTGVDPDTGGTIANTIKAKVTVTFGYPKLGLLVYPGKKHSGNVKTIDIGLGDIKTNSFLLDDNFLKENFPKRSEHASKGDFGKTMLVCGSKKYPGAALLASKAAASIGSGLTALASKTEVLNKITAVMPEVTHVEFNAGNILEESLRASVMVIGPGLGVEEEVKNLVETLITKVNIPIVLDADGINAIATENEILKKAKKDLIITPHPKEFARLLRISVDEVLNNKVELAKNIAKELNCTVVLKGPGTIIATKDERIYISPFSNAALAKGGTGDVLAGFIGGLIAQGLEPTIASCVGVYIHGKTGELISKDKTVFSLLPQDLITYLPSAIKVYVEQV